MVSETNPLRAELSEAIRGYHTAFPPPFDLAPNLGLATRVMAEAVDILDSLVDPDPCDWDHNHSCQTHGFYYVPQGELCPNERARRFVGDQQG